MKIPQKLYLVRHARALPRREWTGEPELRPLSPRGEHEALALAESLAEDPPVRLLSSPALHCQQTLEPLAVALGLEVEVDERLAEGESVVRALELMPTRGEPGPLLLCTHAATIAALLELLELAHADGDQTLPCRKGSVWILDGPGATPSHATYLEPVRRARGHRVLRRLERRSQAPAWHRAAVLDLGSTSFTLLVADVGPGGALRPVVREKVMLRLGAEVAHGGSLPEEAARRAVDVARQLRAVADQEKVQTFLPVATAAIREAANGSELAARLSRALGAPVRILSGAEEARVIFRAFAARLQLGPERTLAIDLGGGSLELALGCHGVVEQEATLPLGAVRLHREWVSRDPMGEEAAAAIRARVGEMLAPHREALLAGAPDRVIAAGGTVRALARLAGEGGDDAPRSSPLVGRLDQAALADLEKRLLPTTHAARLAMRGMRRRRADLLPTAAVTLLELVRQLGCDGFEVCDWGLREGVLLDALARSAFD